MDRPQGHSEGAALDAARTEPAADRTGTAGTGAAGPIAALDPNWLAVLLILVATPLTDLLARLDGDDFGVPPGAILGVIGVSYLAFYRHARKTFPRGPVWVLGLIFIALGLVAAINATSAVASGWANILPAIMSLAAGLAVALAFWLLTWQVGKNARLAAIQVGLVCAMAAFIYAGPIMNFFLMRSGIDLPHIGDQVFHQADILLGLGGFDVIGQLASRSTLFHRFLQFAYDALAPIALLVAFAEAYSLPRRLTGLIYRFFVAACFGYAFYYLLPAIGPLKFYGSSFGFAPATTLDQSVWTDTAITSPRNCMPSLHATWAILIALTLRYAPTWQRVLGALFVVMTLLATLGLGEHYLIDWLAAPPLVLMVRAVATTSLTWHQRERWEAFGIGAGFLCLWVLVLRMAPASLAWPALFAIFAYGSFVLPLLLEARLARAERLGLTIGRGRRRDIDRQPPIGQAML